MLALIPISPWHWVGFVSFVLIFLALDLGVFHRKAKVIQFREALAWSGVWFCLALLFALLLRPMRGQRESLEFLTGYLIELSLSMDNVFIMALVFAHFRIPREYQHRVLFWGILGALIMRGTMIGVGVAIVSRLYWVLYICGAFLLYSGVRTLLVKSEIEPHKSPVVRWVRKFYPVASQLDGQKFLTLLHGRRALTPLALVLVLVETTDLVFAVDSIPAVFAVTTKPFIVFTSNVFAILGLRSLYFVLAGVIGYFRYLKIGLSVVLVFIGIKMIVDPPDVGPKLPFQVDIPIWFSLLGVGVIISSSIGLSIIAAYRERRRLRNVSREEPEQKKPQNETKS
jgi:tellurite resistance protein TerC